MNELNPLLEVMDSIDDRIVSNAVKPAKKHSLPTILAVAAAVSMLVLTGFATMHHGDGRNMVKVEGDRIFYLDLRLHDITIPEEYRTTDEWGYEYYFGRMRDMLPSELFEQFGVSPLFNDNFSEIIEYEPNEERELSDEGEWVLVSTDYGDPILRINWVCVDFTYHLYSKNIQRNITLEASYRRTDDSAGSSTSIDPADEYEIIKLNDGSMCYVDSISADFSYDGVRYYLTIPIADADNDDRSVKMTKQVLDDLGVL